MLPGFRLIAATFFCGFLAVFAGLRLATSLNDFHAALPVMAAHAAPIAVAELEHKSSAVPVMFDLRFAVSTAPKTPPVNVTALVIDRTAPLLAGPPQSIAPREEVADAAAVPAVDAVEPAKPAATVASLPAEAAADSAAAESTTADVLAVTPIDPQTAPLEDAAVPGAADDAPAAAASAASAPAVVESAPDGSSPASSQPARAAPIVAVSDTRPAKAAPRVVRKKRARIAQGQTPPNAANSVIGFSNPVAAPPR